jgi:ketosteroid isomerase-like protein
MSESRSAWSVSIRTTIRAAAGMAASLALAACAPKVDTVALAAQLTQVDEAWSQAAVARNVDSVAAFYAQDATAYPPNDVAAVGFAAAKKVWAGAFADTSYRVSWKTVHAAVSQGGDIGYTTGTYEESYNGPRAKRVTNIGKYVCIWARQPDGTWKAIHDIWNPDTK